MKRGGGRAYAVRADLKSANGCLLEYVKNGGVLVVQYNLQDFDQNYGLYPFELGGKPQKVVEEGNAVTLLEPNHPLFTWPNKIGSEDFQGWEEERGHGFMKTRDKQYTALVEAHDPEQDAQKSGLLIARYGQGFYIYYAFAIYRQLPSGFGLRRTCQYRRGGVVQEFRPHEASVAEVAAFYGADQEAGLSTSGVASRLAQFGSNELTADPGISAWGRFAAQFRDALVILLLAAAGISAVVWVTEGEAALPYETIVIVAIVILNALMGFIQEGRAEAALAALRAAAAPEATVVREGHEQRIPARDLVPGDLMILREGDTIAADARLVHVVELQTMEASLTGESLPVLKSLEPVSGECAVAERVNTVFAGTTATYGHARAIVTSTGMKTEVGSIAGLLRSAKDQITPLQRDLTRIGEQLGLAVIVIAGIVVATMLTVYGVHDLAGLVRVLMFGVALAVAAAPESLSAVVTMVLALGVQKMARCGAIVRKLSAVESLGSVTVIASDKTGTLTKNEMTVRVIVTANGSVELTGAGYSPDGDLRIEEAVRTDGRWKHETDRLLHAATLANNAQLSRATGAWTIQGDPTEGALLVAAAKAGIDHTTLCVRYPRLGEAPFSSDRKRMSTLHHADSDPGERYVFTKGAAGTLLDLCTHELTGHEARELTDARRTAILTENEAMASEALRTLGVAFRRVPGPHLEGIGVNPGDLERDLVFLGLIGMVDPPRPEAREAVARARAAGIRPMLITGDHPATALAIARETGVSVDGRVICGPELEAMSDAELEVAVREVSVFARVVPRHKLRIVTALQRGGEIVAMTGDGVNDAPALKAADIGIAMGITGTDVAKEASDLVLTDDNFATIVVAVEEGRAVFDNIRKTIRYLLSTNAAEVMTVFFAVILARPLGMAGGDGFVLPLLATQILWINLITDGAPSLALGFDPALPNLMARLPRSRKEGVINRPMLAGILLVGLVMTVGTLLVFRASLPGGIPYARTMAFSTLVFFQLFHAFNSRAETDSVFRGFFANKRLCGAVAISLLLHALVLQVPGLRVAFGTVALSLAEWGECLGVASSVLWLVEGAKLIARTAQRGGLSAAGKA